MLRKGTPLGLVRLGKVRLFKLNNIFGLPENGQFRTLDSVLGTRLGIQV